MSLPSIWNQVSSIKYQETRKGFTLIELLLVIAIISILISIGLASFSRAQKQTRDRQRQSDLKNIAGALEQYYSDNNRYPDVATWEDELDGTVGGKVYIKTIPNDPLPSQSYAYELCSGNTQVFSLAADLEINPTTTPTPPTGCTAADYIVSSQD